MKQLLILIFFFGTPFFIHSEALANEPTNHDIENSPMAYSLVLWFDVLQNKTFDQHVEKTIQAAIVKLKEADHKIGSERFKNHFPHPYNVFIDKKILISKTPPKSPSNSFRNGKYMIPFYAFLDDQPAREVAYFIASAFEKASRGRTQAEAWAKHFLQRPPRTESRLAVDQQSYMRKLNPPENVDDIDLDALLNEFIDSSDLDNITFRFRVLNDHQGLMVPIGLLNRLAPLIEGDPTNDLKTYPVITIPLNRFLIHSELQQVKHIISKLKDDIEWRTETVDFSENLISFIVWLLLERKYSPGSKIKSWIPWGVTRLLWFVGGIFIIDEAIETTQETIGIEAWWNERDKKKLKRYEEIFTFLDKNLSTLEGGNAFNMENFRREFCYKLGLRYQTAQAMRVFQYNKTTLLEVREDLHENIRKALKQMAKDQAKVQIWLKRLSEADTEIDRETGLTYYIIPPRERSTAETTSDVIVAGSVMAMAGEFAYSKLAGLRNALKTGRLFGPIAFTSLAIDYLFGISADEPIRLREDKKMLLEDELTSIDRQFTAVLSAFKRILTPLSD